MKTIEFQAEIRDGTIQIPEQYWQDLANQQTVRVIVMEPAATREAAAAKDYLSSLLDSPMAIADFVPLSRDEAHA